MRYDDEADEKNLITFVGILGVLFFGFGCLVILFYDYREFYEKWFK
jgi:hypothetical protein